jgi:hypothetical protein
LPSLIEESFRERVERLPAESQLLLLVAAAEPIGDPVLLWRGPERLAVDAVITLEEIDGQYTITSSELEVVGRVAGIDQAAFERPAQEAEQACPVSRALAGRVEIRSHTRLEAPGEPVETAPRAA